MKPTQIVSACIALATSLVFARSPIGQLHDPEWGSSAKQVQEMIASIAEHTETFTIETTLLPLARDTESYLIARNITTSSDDRIERVVYTFADDALVMITASGNAVSALIETPRDLSTRIGDWRLNNDMSIVMHRATDTVTMLAEDARHPHLFLWDIPEPNRVASPDQSSASIPELFAFGSHRRDIEPAIKALATVTTRERIDPPTLPTHAPHPAQAPDPDQRVRIRVHGRPPQGRSSLRRRQARPRLDPHG